MRRKDLINLDLYPKEPLHLCYSYIKFNKNYTIFSHISYDSIHFSYKKIVIEILSLKRDIDIP